ncbi:MAG: cysteine--tRNA ligase [Eubacteriales bacterium]|nr:cysteine--tRNA ligase [Eubacteriales bacterium]
MQFYNTLSGKKDEFIPIEEGKVRMYACGPTVYNFFHVGNARCFVVFDMLRRYLEYRGYEVKFVQNFTDIDDKVIKKANEEGLTYSEIAKRYIDEYFVDAKGLGVRPATVHPLATDNIDMILHIVKTLVEKGYAYPSNGDVYFRTRKYKDYGKLSGMLIEDLESGARIDVSEQKEDPLDFALWKAAKPGEPAWESPWGMGRPGWHIECSAMVMRYLGETIDIHCGGQDLIFPHHENEIAQSQCCTGMQFCHYWLHNGYINIDNHKMSKSAGNFFTVREIAEKYGYLPIRHFILSSHYRSPINFSKDIIEQSKAALERIFNCVDTLNFFVNNAPEERVRENEGELIAKFDSAKSKMIEAMDDDFNTGEGIAAIYDLVKDINTAVNSNPAPSKGAMIHAKALLDEMTELFGFVRDKDDNDDFIREIEEAIEKRKKAKKAKNYAEADRIRSELLERGVVLLDTPTGTQYRINAQK